MYSINNKAKSGSFICKELDGLLGDTVYLGGKSDNTNSLTGAISAFEVYYGLARTPDNLKNLISQGQRINE